MAVHMAAIDDVFSGDQFCAVIVVVFSNGVLGGIFD